MLGRLRQVAGRRSQEAAAPEPAAADSSQPAAGSGPSRRLLRRRRDAVARPQLPIQHAPAADWRHHRVEPALIDAEAVMSTVSPSYREDVRAIAALLRSDPEGLDAVDQAIGRMMTGLRLALADANLPDRTRLAFEVDDGRQVFETFSQDLEPHGVDLWTLRDPHRIERDVMRHFDAAVASTRNAVEARDPTGGITAISLDGRTYLRVDQPAAAGDFGKVLRFRSGQGGPPGDVCLKIPHHPPATLDPRPLRVGMPSSEARATIGAMGTAGDDLVTPLLGTLRTPGEGLMLINRHARFGDLEHVQVSLADRSIDPERRSLFAMTLARDVLMGATRLEHKGLLHLDLRHANLLVDGQGRCRLGDFGLAQALAPGAEIATAQRHVALVSALAAPPETGGGADVGRAVNAYQAGLVLQRLAMQQEARHGVDPAAWRVLVDGLTEADPRRRWPLDRATGAFDDATRELHRGSTGIGSAATRAALVEILDRLAIRP